MEDFTLPPSKINELTKIFKRVGLNPKDFEWIRIEHSEDVTGLGWPSEANCTRFKYEHRNFYFDFHTINGAYYKPEYRPGIAGIIEKSKQKVEWRAVVVYFEMWLTQVKKELGQPDLWAEVLKSGFPKSIEETSVIREEDEDSYLDNDQVKLLNERLNHVEKQLLEQHGSSTDKAEFIKAEFDYIKRNLKKFNLKDLKIILIGQAIHIALKIASEINIQLDIISAISGILGLPTDMRFLKP